MPMPIIESKALPMQHLNQQIDLEDFVKNATWKDLLVSLIESNSINPWDIDITKLVDSYVGVVKHLKVLDLHVPANIILAAAILLRMKSDIMELFRNELLFEEQQQQEEAVPTQRILPMVEPLVPRLRLQPSKKITLNELMDALDDALKVKERREIEFSEVPQVMQFLIPAEDIDQKMESLYASITAETGKENVTTFANLANTYSNSESILADLFIPMLFLAHKGRILIMQDHFFDEIFIRLNGEKNA